MADHGRQRKYVSSGFLPTAYSIGLVSLAGLLVLVWVTDTSAWASTKASVFLAACALFTFWRWLAMGLSTTDAGLRCRYFIRRRTIPWGVADHFEFQYAGSVRGAGPYLRVILVKTDGGAVRVPAIVVWKDATTGRRKRMSRLVWDDGADSADAVLDTLNDEIAARRAT